jgi:hypothetical protein
MSQAPQAPEIIARHLGWNPREIADARYMPHKYPAPCIYVCGDDFFCAPTDRQTLPQIDGLNWTLAGTGNDRVIYSATPSY